LLHGSDVDLAAADHAPTPAARPFARLARRMWLSVLVHLDAFCLAPLTSAQAAAWRLRGYKVRSRNRIAALAGRSPRAYALWIARHEPDALADAGHGARQIIEIVPVIDCRGGHDGVEDTIRSLGRAGGRARPVIIGAPVVARAMTIGSPRDLVSLATGEGLWLCPLRPGDRLAPGALDIYAAVAAMPGIRIAYADDDLIVEGRRADPHFKPQWDPELSRHHDYLSGASVLFATRDTLSRLPDAGWTAALVAAAVQPPARPTHIPRVLHHRRARPLPFVPATPADPLGGAAPSLSVIIPTRNHLALLRTCIAGLERTAYPGIEKIVIDNGSDDPATLAFLEALEARGVKVLRMPGAFNYSRLNNAAAREAQGEYLCFLNNDVDMVNSDWLSLLLCKAQQPDLGAVGARLLYPDGTIQHAGVLTGIGGGAGHGHRFQRVDDPGYFERARLPQRVTAVTAACLVVAREKFLAVDGFDEDEFPVAFNDVDLCLKHNPRGWQSLYEPRATLIHHESKSRGKDSVGPNRLRFAGELAALKRKWHTDTHPDPFHHPHLSPFCEQFVIAV
jgi:GT2 family glycosyltransferase